jgi:hypothetical protein
MRGLAVHEKQSGIAPGSEAESVESVAGRKAAS